MPGTQLSASELKTIYTISRSVEAASEKEARRLIAKELPHRNSKTTIIRPLRAFWFFENKNVRATTDAITQEAVRFVKHAVTPHQIEGFHRYWRDVKKEEASKRPNSGWGVEAQHQKEVVDCAAQMRGLLTTVALVPSATVSIEDHGTWSRWGFADALATLRDDSGCMEVLMGHFTPTKLAPQFKRLSDDLHAYEAAINSALASVRSRIKKANIVIIDAQNLDIAVYQIGADEACRRSEDFSLRRTRRSEFTYLGAGPLAMHLDESKMILAGENVSFSGKSDSLEHWQDVHVRLLIGNQQIGIVRSYDAALEGLRTIEKIVQAVKESPEFDVVAKQYFRLVVLTDYLRSLIPDSSANKWAVDGSCSMCPTSESDQP